MRILINAKGATGAIPHHDILAFEDAANEGSHCSGVWYRSEDGIGKLLYCFTRKWKKQDRDIQPDAMLKFEFASDVDVLEQEKLIHRVHVLLSEHAHRSALARVA